MKQVDEQQAQRERYQRCSDEPQHRFQSESTDDADIAQLSSDDEYDLALAKTNLVTGSGEDAIIDYTITVANQGTLNSRGYTVVDIVPPGLLVDTTTISDGGVYDMGAGTITWSMGNLTPTASTQVQWSASVSDFTLRPFRNYAEITEDGSGFYGVTDIDSTPDESNTNDGDYDTPGVDNTTIGQAGLGVDPEDDADIAHLGDADRERGEHQWCDDHLDQTQEHRRDESEIGHPRRGVGAAVVDGRTGDGTEHEGDQDPERQPIAAARRSGCGHAVLGQGAENANLKTKNLLGGRFLEVVGGTSFELVQNRMRMRFCH